MNLLLGVRSDKGHRAENEDSIAMDERLGLFLVADGTGGRAGGNTASRLACETIYESVAARQNELERLDDNAIRALLQQAVGVEDRKRTIEMTPGRFEIPLPGEQLTQAELHTVPGHQYQPSETEKPQRP